MSEIPPAIINKKPCHADYKFDLRTLRGCIFCGNYPRCKSETFASLNGELIKRC